MKKVIIVTGASSGIGKATALQLIKEGHQVYGAARRINHMKELEEAGGNAIALDITDHEMVQKEVQKIIDTEGRIDVLVNNAGYAVYGPVEEISYEQAKQQFDVNLFGLAEITKAVLPSMRKQNDGTIINVSSVGGKVYTPLGAWYHASKYALEGWSDCLRLEVKQFGVKVVIIEPGVIKTEFAEVMDSKFSIKGDSSYKEMKQLVSKMMESTSKEGQYSEPSVIANTISKAINSLNPRTRYAAGKMASTTLMARRFLGDKTLDKVLLRLVGNFGK